MARKFEVWQLDNGSEIRTSVQVWYGHSPQHGHRSFFFDLDLGDRSLKRFSHTDVKLLREKAETALKSKIAIEWQPKLLVHVRCRGDNRGSKDTDIKLHSWGMDFKLSVETLDIGEYQGKKYQRDGRVQEGWPHVGKPNTFSEYDMVAMIDDTPENRAALNSIIDNWHESRHRLLDLFNPHTIQNTITAAKAGLPLMLGDGKEKPDASK